MPKVVICPSCQSKGSIPDNAPAARIRCPKCGQTFDVQAATKSSASGSVKRPAAAEKPDAALSAYEDLETVQPLAPLASSGVRRAPAPPRDPRRTARDSRRWSTWRSASAGWPWSCWVSSWWLCSTEGANPRPAARVVTPLPMRARDGRPSPQPRPTHSRRTGGDADGVLCGLVPIPNN